MSGNQVFKYYNHNLHHTTPPLPYILSIEYLYSINTGTSQVWIGSKSTLNLSHYFVSTIGNMRTLFNYKLSGRTRTTNSILTHDCRYIEINESLVIIPLTPDLITLEIYISRHNMINKVAPGNIREHITM